MGKIKFEKNGKGANKDSQKEIFRERKKKRLLKSARLVVRNLPFKCSKTDVEKHFSQFGKVTEVTLLKKQDKFVGCGFVQFEKKNDAAKAIHRSSGTSFMGRPIIADWAVAKDKFESFKRPEPEADIEIKSEVLSDEEIDANTSTECMDTSTVKSEDESESELDDDDDDDDHYDEYNDDDEFENEAVPHRKKTYDDEDKPRPKLTIADISHTIFVKNVPFSATDKDLKECALEHGKINYALVCIDPMTEHSKGSGFIQFEDAQVTKKILDDKIQLSIRGVILKAFKPINRDEINDAFAKTKAPKDNRNLYLVKEGVIIAGSPAAKDLSNGDMAKRLELDSWKSQALKNLHMFVSPTRLVIHNLPPSYDDKKLKLLFLKNSPKRAMIREARVMKDLKQLQASGAPISKRYGFVSFTKHEDALHALRKLNNNPTIFSPNKRPIVAFSIENRKALQVKERRLQNSRLALTKSKDESDTNAVQDKTDLKQKTKNDSKKPFTNKKHDKFAKSKPATDQTVDKPEYAGMTAKFGRKKLRSKKELIYQKEQHFKNNKKFQKNKKLSRKQIRARKGQYYKPSNKQK